MLQPATLRFWNCDWPTNSVDEDYPRKRDTHFLFFFLCSRSAAAAATDCRPRPATTARAFRYPSRDDVIRTIPPALILALFHFPTLKHRNADGIIRNLTLCTSKNPCERNALQKDDDGARRREKVFDFAKAEPRGEIFLPFSMRRSFVCREMTGKGIKRCALAIPPQ